MTQLVPSQITSRSIITGAESPLAERVYLPLRPLTCCPNNRLCPSSHIGIVGASYPHPYSGLPPRMDAAVFTLLSYLYTPHFLSSLQLRFSLPSCVRLDLVELASLSSPHILVAAPAASGPGDGGSERKAGFSKIHTQEGKRRYFSFFSQSNVFAITPGSTSVHWWFEKKICKKKRKILAQAQTTSYENCNQTTTVKCFRGGCVGWRGWELYSVL